VARRIRLPSVCRTTGLLQSVAYGERNTHPTVLMRLGVHPKVAQERLGHTNVGIALNIYSHVSPHM
jgi:site-specific recombinase XerD